MSYGQRNKRRKVKQEYTLPHICQLSLCSPLSVTYHLNNVTLPSNILHPLPCLLPSPSQSYISPSLSNITNEDNNNGINPVDSHILDYISVLFFGNKQELSSGEARTSLKDFTLYESFDSISGVSKGALLPDIESIHPL